MKTLLKVALFVLILIVSADLMSDFIRPPELRNEFIEKIVAIMKEKKEND